MRLKLILAAVIAVFLLQCCSEPSEPEMDMASRLRDVTPSRL